MRSSTFDFKGQDGTRIFAYKWEPEGGPVKACLLIAHGTAEHALRYADFAAHFAEAGMACYAADLRGHGKTAAGKLGASGPDGWNATLDDLALLAGIMRKENPKAPIFFVGHSSGSLLAQAFMQTHPELIAGTVLSASCGHQSFKVLGLGALLGHLLVAFQGVDRPSPAAYAMSFGTYNKPFLPSATESDFDWLSRDREVTLKYVADPLCGFEISNGMALQSVLGWKKTWKAESEARIPLGHPVLVLAGTDDMFSLRLKELKPLVARYKARGMTDVTEKYYEGARHEVFNETNRSEVLGDVQSWIEARLSPA